MGELLTNSGWTGDWVPEDDSGYTGEDWAPETDEGLDKDRRVEDQEDDR